MSSHLGPPTRAAAAEASPPGRRSQAEAEAGRYSRANIVAKWCVPVNRKMYRIEFEHGTTTGRRMIWVNGRAVLRRDWMFKLVGDDAFTVAGLPCLVRVDPAPGFRFDYQLFIDGKPYDAYADEQARAYRLWIAHIDGHEYRVVLELDSLVVWLNDRQRDEAATFVDGGTDTRFLEDGAEFVLQARSSGNRRDGIVHTLLANGATVMEAKLHEIMQEPTSILSENLN